MVSKRGFSGDDGDRGSKKWFPNVFKDVMNGHLSRESEAMLESRLREMVREEVEYGFARFLNSSPSSSCNQNESRGSGGFELQFVNQLPQKIFTNSKIQAEGNMPLEIVIVDSNSKNKITSGPLSCLKVEILALDGDLRAIEQGDWTEKEFEDKVLRERDGRRPLVIGDLVVTLQNGVGYIGGVTFTDNSSWIKCRKFRLGVRIVGSKSIEVRVREAISEPFVVKDHRGESYQKHHPPHLSDEVWRLDKIAKDGKFHTLLASRNITTVKDLLQCYFTNPSELRKILSGGGSNRTSDIIINHARECVIEGENFYIYNGIPQNAGLLLNTVYEVAGVTFDHQNFYSVDMLDVFQKRLLSDLKQQAYQNLDLLIPVIGPVAISPSGPLTQQALPLSAPTLHIHPPELLETSHDSTEARMGINDPTTSYTSSIEEYNTHIEEGHVAFSPIYASTLRNSFVMRYPNPSSYEDGATNWTASSSQGPDWQNSEFSENDFPQAGMSYAQIDIYSSFPSFGVHIANNGTPKAAGWRKIRCKIRSAVKLMISAKRMARPVEF